MASILVTGAAGFIGARTAELLLADGHTVVGTDNLNDYYAPALKQHRLSRLRSQSGFTFFPIDVEDRARVEQLFHDHTFNAVINLAARAGVRASIEDPHVYLATNTQGTLNLLEAMRHHRVPKLVIASTSSLYAGTPLPFREDVSLNRPLSPYAASKLAAEVMAYTYHHLFGLDVTVLRYFTVYGPAGRPDMSPYRFVKWIDEGTPIEVYGDGTQTRDFTYVDDIARGTVQALKPLGYEIINLGGGNTPISINRMIEWLSAQLGRPAQVIRQPFHAAEMRDTQADIGKARRLLDWTPLIQPEEGFQRTVDWYVSHRDWLRANVPL
jgi:UDP-glucuronate 4-epimerase